MGQSSAASFSAAVIVVGTLAASASYNAASDFSAAQGGSWSYFGQLNGVTAPLGTVTPSCGGTSGVTCVSNGQAPPNQISVTDNASGGPVGSGGVQIASGTLSLDPGPGAAIVQWMAPAAGTYSITGSFTGEDPAGASDVSIFDSMGTMPLLGPALLSGYQAVSPFNFDNVTFKAGDFVDFVVSATTNGAALANGYPALNTGLPVTIDPSAPQIFSPLDAPLGGSRTDVPEPGSLALLAGAVLGIGLARRKARG